LKSVPVLPPKPGKPLNNFEKISLASLGWKLEKPEKPPGEEVKVNVPPPGKP